MICWNILHASASGILFFWQELPFAFHDIIEQLAPFHVFHDQEQLFGSLDDFIKLYDTGMPDQFQDVDFSWYPLHISYINNFFFLQDLHRHFLSG